MNQLQEEKSITEKEIQASPLALIRSLDDYLAATRLTTATQLNVSFEENTQNYWLVPVTLASRRTPHLNQQAMQRTRWFEHHAVLPTRTAHNIDVVLIPTRSSLDATLTQLAVQSDAVLRVWIAHFDDPADVKWDRSLSPVQNWRSQSVTPHAPRQASLLSALKTAQNHEAHIVVFPEFTLDLEHRAQLVAHLSQLPKNCLQLIVAGAFHEPTSTAAHMPAYNTAPVLNENGTRLFSHRKLRLFGNKEAGAEFVEAGQQLTVLVTPIGCMTVLICKDFLDEDAHVNNLLTEVPVDWVWVPSYGDETTLKLHKKRAHKLATLTTGASSAVAQTQNTAMKQPGQTQSFLPGFGHQAGTSDPQVVSSNGSLVVFSLRQHPKPPAPSRPALKRIK